MRLHQNRKARVIPTGKSLKCLLCVVLFLVVLGVASLSWAQTVTISDNFEGGYPGGGSGWSASWTRSPDLAARVDRVSELGSWRLRLTGGAPQAYAQRTANLSICTSATVSFDYRVDLDNNEYVYFKIYDGASSQTLLTLTDVNNSASYTASNVYTIPTSYLTTNFAVRYETGSTNNVSDLGLLDNVVITCTAGLRLSVDTTCVSETAGLSAATGTVTRYDCSGSLDVEVNSSNTDAVTLNGSTSPITVTLGAGVCSGTFNVDTVDDATNGPRPVTLTATAPGYLEPATARVFVLDNDDTTQLTVALDEATISEGAGVNATKATVIRSTTAGSLNVTLTSGDTSEALIEGGVAALIKTISIGACSATFQINAVDDADSDGTQTVTLTGSAVGYTDGTATLFVEDNELPLALAVRVSPRSFKENVGDSAAVGTVVRTTDTGAMTVTVTSNDSSELTFSGSGATSITVAFAAGSLESATFQVDAEDDTDIDGPQTVTVTASLAGWDPGIAMVEVLDNDYLGRYSGMSLGYPTFFFTASYDWLHNFGDRNQAVPTSTNPATDNFNKIILIDSNLFPIYTALEGDDEFPNIAMRNWTSGPGDGPSPSVNDYMNRSIAVAANYINKTSRIPILYGGTDYVKAYGLRSYMQWAYVLDPANANFRRYKFIKIADVTRPPLLDTGIPMGDVDRLEPTAGESSIGDCENCDVCHWYAGTSDELLCNGTGKEIACCSYIDSPAADPCFEGDDMWLFYSKRPDGACTDPGSGDTIVGGKAADMPKCINENFPPSTNVPVPHNQPLGAPYARFPILVSTEDLDAASGGKVRVRFEFEGHGHDSASGLAFVLNHGLVASCEVTEAVAPMQNFDGAGQAGYIAQPKDFMLPVGAASCTQCTSKAYQEFSASAGCAQDYTDEYSYMYVDVYPCQGTGIVLRIPGVPPPQDNAFRIPVAGVDNITGGELTGLTTDQINQLIDNRWGNINAYMNTMPPESYAGYPSYTAAPRTLGYGFTTNTSFAHARNIRFKEPLDIDVYRDYFDYPNQGPLYIFVADTGNSRIQVFMNATGSAGDVGATFPIRPVPVKGPNFDDYSSNELALRISGNPYTFGNGRSADWRQYTSLPGTFLNISAGQGEFYYPHSLAVDQDPDTKDVYLFVADTFNHRIQVFRDAGGVTSNAITNKRFDFQYVGGFGTYPMYTGTPGPFNLRYPKGVDVARYHINSSYLYVVDSGNYRVLQYKLGDPGASLSSGEIACDGGFGFDGTRNLFVKSLCNTRGTPITGQNITSGFLDPQDVATGYTGFYRYTSEAGGGWQFLNNYMVYVTDPARNNASWSKERLNLRVQQMIQVPGFGGISGVSIPWDTEPITLSAGPVRESVFGLYSGVFASDGSSGTGSTQNVPGQADLFTDRPFGIASLHWNTQKPMDIRVMQASDAVPGVADTVTGYVNGQALPRNVDLRIGVNSRRLFMPPEDKVLAFMSSSTQWNEITGRWDAMSTGTIHLFCYNIYGYFTDHIALTTAPYIVRLSNYACPSKGFVKLVAEDVDFKTSGRTGTMFFGIQ